MKGFTLIELLVSVSILALMAGMSISAYPKFSEQMGVTSETYNLLAFYRETQTYGVSAYNVPGQKSAYVFTINSDTNTLKRWQIQSPTDTSNNYYLTCINNPSSCTLDSTFTPYTLKDQYKILLIEGIKSNATTTIRGVYVIFKRPNPEARLVGTYNSSVFPDGATGSFDKIIVTLASKRNEALTKKVVILSTGQIYVQDW